VVILFLQFIFLQLSFYSIHPFLNPSSSKRKKKKKKKKRCPSVVEINSPIAVLKFAHKNLVFQRKFQNVEARAR